MNNTVDEQIGGYVAVDNKVAAARVVDELATRDDVLAAMVNAVREKQKMPPIADVGKLAKEAKPLWDAKVDALIARGWLKVRG